MSYCETHGLGVYAAARERREKLAAARARRHPMRQIIAQIGGASIYLRAHETAPCERAATKRDAAKMARFYGVRVESVKLDGGSWIVTAKFGLVRP